MKTISYTYKIIKVDQEARCMEVVYSSEGRQPMHVSVRIPYEWESLDAVIDSFAPTPYWAAIESPLLQVREGAEGVMTVALVADGLADQSGPLNQREMLLAAVQSRLDSFAQERGYTNILSACSYANSTIDKYRQEAARCIALRDATWEATFRLLDEVDAGLRPPFADANELVALLPAAVWLDEI